jgi:hypothetical protein
VRQHPQRLGLHALRHMTPVPLSVGCVTTQLLGLSRLTAAFIRQEAESGDLRMWAKR